MVGRLVLFVVATLFVACAMPSTFTCHDDQQCNLGVDGRCIDNTCAFPASGCPSGYRFDDRTAGSRNNQCAPSLDMGGIADDMATPSDLAIIPVGPDLAPLPASTDLASKSVLGTSCHGDGDCASGHCTDGVCCVSSGCGACKSCGGDGMCQPVPIGVTDNRCTAPSVESCSTGKCDGAGHCATLPDGHDCSAWPCADPGTHEHVMNYGACHGGICDAPDPHCYPIIAACSGPNACLTSCVCYAPSAMQTDCVSGFTCAGCDGNGNGGHCQ